MNSVLRLLGVVLAPVLALMTLFWIGPKTGVGTTAGTLLLVGLLTGVLIRSRWSTAYIVALGLVWIIYAIMVHTGMEELPLLGSILLEILLGVLPGAIGAAIGTVFGQWLEERWSRPHTTGTT
jgi:hypothetical protein